MTLRREKAGISAFILGGGITVGAITPWVVAKVGIQFAVLILAGVALSVILIARLQPVVVGILFVELGWFAATLVSDSSLADPLVSLGGKVSLSPTKILPFAFLIPGIILLTADLMSRRIGRPRWPMPIWLLFAYSVWLSVSAAFSPLDQLAWLRWAHGAVPLIAVMLVLKQKERSPILVVPTIVACFTHVVIATIIDRRVVETPKGPRMSGYLHPVLLSLTGAVSVVAGTWFLLHHRGRSRWLALPMIALGTIAIIGSGGRMGFVAGIAGLSVVLLTQEPKTGRPRVSRRVWAALLIFVGLMFGLVGGSVEQWLARGADEKTASFELKTLTGRTTFWEKAVFPLIAERPILGWGPGFLRSGEFAEDLKLHRFGFGGSAHNSLFEAAVAGGVISATLWLAAVILLLKRAFRLRDRFRGLRLGLWMILVMMAITESGASWWGIGWYLFLGLALFTLGADSHISQTGSSPSSEAASRRTEQRLEAVTI